ncbi:MAG: TetR/AcrR family transcriptional regulator [Burkholderiaceae bacterium]
MTSTTHKPGRRKARSDSDLGRAADAFTDPGRRRASPGQASGTTRGASSRYHHGDLRRALLTAAAGLADLENLSLRELAAGIGVTAAAAYRHFENREALLDALALDGFAALQARFEAVCPMAEQPADAAQAMAQLGRLGEAYLRFADDSPALWRLMFGAHGARSRTDEPRTGRPNSYAYLPAALAALFVTGVIPTAPSAADEIFAWSTIHGAATLRQGRVAAAQGAPDGLAAMLVARIVRGLGGAGAPVSDQRPPDCDNPGSLA